MQRRTLFGIFSHATDEVWFSVFFVTLRVFIGFSAFFYGVERLSDWSVINDLSINAFFSSWFEQVFAFSIFETLLPWMMIIFGICLILGMLVRPASIILLICYFLIYAWTFISFASSFNFLLVIVCLMLFLSGGGGHIVGLDYFLYSYAREHNWVTKFLVG